MSKDLRTDNFADAGDGLCLRTDQARALGRLFTAQIEEAFGRGFGLVQSKAKIFEDLRELGYAEKRTLTTGAWPSRLLIIGWALTLAGHQAYCEWCGENIDDDEPTAEAKERCDVTMPPQEHSTSGNATEETTRVDAVEEDRG